MSDAAESSPNSGPAIRRLTVVAEHLDPQHDLSAFAGLNLIAALAERGIAVTVHCGLCPDWARPRGIEVHQLNVVPWRTHRLVRWQRSMSRAVEAARAEDAAVLSLTPMVRGDVTLLLSGTERGRLMHLADPVGIGPMATMRRALALAKPAAFLRTQLERRALSAGSKQGGAADTAGPIGVFSPAAADEIATLRGEQADAPAVLPLAVGRSAVDPGQVEQQSAALRRGLGITEQAAVILFPAARPLTHGFGPLMLALRQLLDTGRSVVVLLAGRYRYTHLSWVAELGVRDAVRFVGPTQRLEVLYGASDLVAHPTYYDPGGVAVLLALAAGKPVVTTRACAAAPLLAALDDSPYAAVLDPLAYPQALAEALDAALDPAGRAQAAAKGRGLVQALSPETQAQRVLALLLAARSPGPLALPAESD